MSTVKVNNILDVAGTALPANLLPVTASAWVNFNGTGVVAINDSYNVSSITDNGTGDYGVNFTTPLANANYAVATHTRDTNASAIRGNVSTADDANTVRVQTLNAAQTVFLDVASVSIVILGGQ